MDKNALFEFKTDGKNVKLKVNAMTGNDITNALLNTIDEFGDQEEEVMVHAQGKA